MMKPDGFDDRVSRSLTILSRAFDRAERPVVLCSFGKDSLCLLALLDQLAVEPDIAYFELGSIPGAHRFARRFIASQRLRVTLLRPHGTLVAAGAGGADLAYHFDLANGDSLKIVGATFDDHAERQPSCGLDANLVRAGRHDPYDWDLVLTGRRRVDIDPTLGSLDIDAELVILDHGTELLMPLADWSDHDVAYFLAAAGTYAPDWDRYELSGSALQSKTDKTANPDYANICIRCLTSDGEAKPNCPLLSDRAQAGYALSEREFFESGYVPPTVML